MSFRSGCRMAWSRCGITAGIDFPRKIRKAALKSFRQYLLFAAYLNPVWTGCGFFRGVRVFREVMASRPAQPGSRHCQGCRIAAQCLAIPGSRCHPEPVRGMDAVFRNCGAGISGIRGPKAWPEWAQDRAATDPGCRLARRHCPGPGQCEPHQGPCSARPGRE